MKLYLELYSHTHTRRVSELIRTASSGHRSSILSYNTRRIEERKFKSTQIY